MVNAANLPVPATLLLLLGAPVIPARFSTLLAERLATQGEGHTQLWSTVCRALFRASRQVQVFRDQMRGPSGDALWDHLVRELRKATDLPFVLATTISALNLTNDDSGAVVILAELVGGPETWHRLLSAPLWFTRSLYIILADTSALHEELRCSNELATNLSRALWLRHFVATASVVLTPCPWRLDLYSPYQDTDRARRKAIVPSNVSELATIVKRRFHNFRRHPWWIALFPIQPELIKTHPYANGSGTAIYSGIDGWFLRVAAEYLNFTPKLVYPRDNESRGYVINGTGTGTLGLVMMGEAFISINSRFIISYDTDDIEFTHPYTFDELCVMVPRAGRVPNYITIFRCFQASVWIALLGLYVLGVVVLLHVNCVHSRRRPRPIRRTSGVTTTTAFAVCVLLTFGSTARPFIYLRAKVRSAALVLALGLLFNVVFMGAFQGILFQSMTSPQYYPEINSLSALADSNLPIATSSLALKDTFAFPTDVMQRIASNFRVLPRGSRDESRAYGFLVRRLSAYIWPANRRQHLIPECPRKYLLGYIIRRGLPFKRELNSLLLRCEAAGLTATWLESTYRFKPDRRPPSNHVITIEEVEAAFFVLFVGLLTSVLVLTAEKIVGRRRARRGIRCGAEKAK